MSFRQVILFLFVIVSISALQARSALTVGLFTLLLMLSFSSLVPIVFSKSAAIRLVISIGLFLILYGVLFQGINMIELWRDEIGVIELSGYDFGIIATSVFHSHVAALPLDYWGMHFWRNIVALTSPAYHEFMYRIPYMIIHGISAFLFATIVEYSARNSTEQKNKLLIFLLSFVTYLCNPILFAYSLEVRFYSLASLGSMAALYLFIRRQIYNIRYFSLLLLFCLNSIFQFIVLLPYIACGFIYGFRARTNALVMLLSVAILCVYVYPLLLVVTGVGSKESLFLVAASLSKYWVLHFGSIFQSAGAMIFFIWALLVLRSTSKYLYETLLFYIIAIALVVYYNQYFDVHVRHFIVVIPVMLYVLFLPLVNTRGVKRFAIALAMTSLFTVPWTIAAGRLVYHQTLFSKSLIGSKKLAETARLRGLDVLIAPNNGSALQNSVYDFYVYSAEWYVKSYSSSSIMRPKSKEEMCLLFRSDARYLVYSLTGDVDCLSNKTNTEHLYGSIVYYPL